MRAVALLIMTITAFGCSYQGSQLFRRSTCNSVVDAIERARCLEQANQSENAYKQDVERATKKQ